MKLTEALTKAQAKMVRADPDVSRLISKAELGDGGCWLWTGSRNSKGYGGLAFRGKTWRAHRVSYTLFCGEIPDGLLVCHHCDVPECVNPSHLFLGHITTNMKDMVRKGRARNLITSEQSHLKAGHVKQGQDASAAIFTDESAVEVFHRVLAGELTKDLAVIYGVDTSTICRLLRGDTFKHLKRPPGLPRKVGRYRRIAGRSILDGGREP